MTKDQALDILKCYLKSSEEVGELWASREKDYDPIKLRCAEEDAEAFRMAIQAMEMETEPPKEEKP